MLASVSGSINESTQAAMRYKRAPSDEFRAVLSGAGLLAPLLRVRTVAGLRLDVHLREDDHVHAYCGLTRLVDASLKGGRIRVCSHQTYKKQPCAVGLFRNWDLREPGFESALERYLAKVAVAAAQTKREGSVQAAWASVKSPWTLLDREAVIGYDSTKAQSAARASAKVAAARGAVALLADSWANLPHDMTGAELDQLAVDGVGNLVLLELKFEGASPDSIYYAPLQLLQYVHEWHGAFDTLRNDLNRLRDARVELGLSPASMPKITGGLRPAIGFGEDQLTPTAEPRLRSVCAIANKHLPPDVPPIEVWALRGGVPVLLF